ncbi:MAG: hypothetical protein GY862_20345 [Gammaproteobacteria bacterium]|nr:hypothetical protein [Gammaproteobacteria bacterium]
MLHAGRRVELLDLRMRQDWDTYRRDGNLSLSDLSDYRAIRIGDAVTLYLQGAPHALTVREKSHRNDGDGPKVTVRAASPTALLEDRLISKTWPSVTAREACEELAGSATEWNIISRRIPAGRLTCENATHIAMIRRIARAAGAVVQTGADGTLRVQYRFPASVPGWAAANPDQIHTGRADNLSCPESYRSRDRWNAAVISDESAETGERTYNLEYEKTDSRNGILRVYAEPWAGPDEFGVRHTGHASVLTGAGVIVPRAETQEVEFKAGPASLRCPVYILNSVRRQHKDLAPVLWKQGKKEIAATGGGGYSVAQVSHAARAIEFAVNHAVQQQETTQFLIVENI